ncbi:hypothetical protein [Catenuloplanes atrovinosus]|uniref:Uncharacterized protein n=1 Tax=Catenuloplanes atrovinosus TaxID=137266 RepID=A0AAE4CE61_9ACTN|nr:hypothetical protein [Catenuloplanes atrovinosus]MDR7280813.1 hypothetical protein [Catenuloplanes atrovinosus]
MTELEDLRRELHAPLGPEAGTIDLDVIVAKGRRLRWRRRLIVAGTAAAVLAAGVAVPVLYRPDPPVGPVAAGETAPSAGWIRTGAPDGRILQLERGPDGRLLLVTGWALGESLVVQAEMSDGASDRVPGFHVFTVPGETGVVFGYHVGPADRIVAEIDGRTEEAQRWPWPDDPGIVVFWFPAVESPDPVVGNPRVI